MSPWPVRLLAISGVLFLAGWGLAVAFWDGGYSTGASELFWRIGGLMVYASVPTFLIAAIWALATLARAAARRWHDPTV